MSEIRLSRPYFNGNIWFTKKKTDEGKQVDLLKACSVDIIELLSNFETQIVLLILLNLRKITKFNTLLKFYRTMILLIPVIFFYDSK